MSVCLLKKDKVAMREITPNHILSEEDIMPQTYTPKQLIVEQKTENVEEESADVFETIGFLLLLTLILGAFVLSIDGAGAIQFLYDIVTCLVEYLTL